MRASCRAMPCHALLLLQMCVCSYGALQSQEKPETEACTRRGMLHSQHNDMLPHARALAVREQISMGALLSACAAWPCQARDRVEGRANACILRCTGSTHVHAKPAAHQWLHPAGAQPH